MDGEIVYIRADLAETPEGALEYLKGHAEREWGVAGDEYSFSRRVWMRSAPDHPDGPGWMVPTKKKWGECEYWEFLI